MSLLFDKPTTCAWCLAGEATTMLYATPTCLGCAGCSAKDRVTKWQRAVKGRQGVRG
jgi:hypothetical protein